MRELTGSGSVPELRVINKSDQPVLLIEAEEMEGAKQNWVLNTSILLKENSETLIPVSCTEECRWNCTSSQLADSGVVMPRKARVKKGLYRCDIF